jgi:hypothetical protein
MRLGFFGYLPMSRNMIYYSKNLLVIFAVVIGISVAVACNDGSFSGSNEGVSKSGDQSKKKDPQKTGIPDAGDDNNDDNDEDIKKDDEDLGEEDDSDKSDDEDITTDDDSISQPQQCNATNGKVVTGVTECPANNAAFTSDDGSGTRIGCCPLPSKDILDKASKSVGRGGSCQTDEIAVGSDGNGFKCRKINTKKYKLEVAQPVCYRGNGASGGSGSASCNNIIAQLQGLISLENDKDGCVAQPYGAVMTHKTGKDCRDQKASVIVEKATGKPVQMFP